MSATPRKPPTPGNPPRQPSINPTPTAATNSNGTPNRSPSRMAPQAATATGTAATVSRARSVKNGASVSARAAARKPAESDAAVDDMKAEMQARLDELQERLQEAERTCEDSQKQAAFLQMKLDEARKEQGSLEESVHEHTERMEELQNEKKESLRARRELEQIYEAERVQSMREREDAQAKEEEMQSAMQRMKEGLAQREMRAGLEDERRPSMSRAASFRSNNASPNPDSSGQFAPPSSLQRSDSRSSSKLVMQKDKIIEGLRMELAEAQIKLVEVENMGGGRMHDLQKQIYDIKMQNARLMEENESFQLLLSEKTLNGDFSHSDLLRPHSIAGSRPPSRHPNEGGGTSLADELASQADSLEGISDEQVKRLQSEVNSAKDQNKALTLYINNIISRLLQHEQFEQILDKTPDLMAGPGTASMKYAAATAVTAPASVNMDKELPPPPPEKDTPQLLVGKDEQQEPTLQPSGFLQRAKSAIGGRPKARPMSQMVGSTERERLQQQLKAEDPQSTENPETAPRVPLGRSNSTRGNSGHRRANSEWPAASVVTSIYRGRSPSGLQGPASPGLISPTGGRTPFFATPQPLGSRVPSGSSVPTISSLSNKENAVPMPQRDSKMSNPNSHRSSMTSNPGNNVDVEAGDIGSNPSSPPRSTTSSGDRDSRSGGAVMMGSKPRPLRLVREAAEQDEAAKKAANRGSWFGWMNKGGAAPGLAGRSVSGGPEGTGQ
ncbi:hypothetical protein LTR36_008582 [Oleoguttula mirabilis]|uniref:M serotype protein n=1 Tax=Oleoguttula mirabilis TaxID=1507867 RepID=A0AAV9JTG7_9PEZI|nr:hypothetical protein LTR36_008582 [Oleoguttula mirabilis]